MNKKGIALKLAVELIAAIIFAVVVLYIFLQTGLLGTFRNFFGTFMCTLTSYGRGMILQVIWVVWSIMMVMLTVVMLTTGNALAIGVATQSISEHALRSALRSSVSQGVIMAITGVSVITILTYFMVTMIFSNIPLICPQMTTSLGTVQNPTSVEKFLSTTSTQISDCWSMMGAGKFDPLWGVDPPNPRICFIIETHLSTQSIHRTLTRDNITAWHIYNHTFESYQKNWEFDYGDDSRIAFYCWVDKTQPPKLLSMDNLGSCEFVNSRIFIMYLDKHDYDLLAYGTSVCDGLPGKMAFIESWFGTGNRDGVVVCIESL